MIDRKRIALRFQDDQNQLSSMDFEVMEPAMHKP